MFLKNLEIKVEIDLRHFRRLVALLIMKTISDYLTKLTGSFPLFFSKIFLDISDCVSNYYVFQLKHRVF